MNATIDCPAFFPQPSCSGSGICNYSTGTCECYDGWTAIGDIASQPGISCSINNVAIRVLWAICLFCSFIFFVLTTKFVLFRYFSPSTNNKKKPQCNDALAVFSICFWIESVSAIILSILKLINPEVYAIGIDPFATVLFAIFYITGVDGICAYLHVLIDFLAKNANKMMSNETRNNIQKESDILKKWALVVGIIIYPASFIPMFNIRFPTNDREIACAVLISFVFIASFLIGSCLRYLGIIIRDIDTNLEINSQTQNQEQSHSRSEIRRNKELLIAIRAQLVKARVAMFLFGPSSIIMFGTLAAWELLSRNTSYLWPLQLAATDVQFIPIVASMMPSGSFNALLCGCLKYSSESESGARTPGAKPQRRLLSSVSGDANVRERSLPDGNSGTLQDIRLLSIEQLSERTSGVRTQHENVKYLSSIHQIDNTQFGSQIIQT